jgi:hypothetical protein
MDIEKVALEAIKQKIEEIFKKVQVNTILEGRDIVVRITLPTEIMQYPKENYLVPRRDTSVATLTNLDDEAQKAADELLGL